MRLISASLLCLGADYDRRGGGGQQQTSVYNDIIGRKIWAVSEMYLLQIHLIGLNSGNDTTTSHLVKNCGALVRNAPSGFLVGRWRLIAG